jgi:3-oxoacyl-[acyl-carrier protein] reductase
VLHVTAMSAATRREILAAGAGLSLAARAASDESPAPRTRLLEGKTAIVYGAAGDIGSGVCRAFAREGAHVCLVGRTLEKLTALRKEIIDAGGSAEAARVDALDREAVSRHLDAVLASRGRVDVSFNLVGLGGPQGTALTQMSHADFHLPIDTAMRTHYFTATAAGRHMAKQRSGVILMLTAQVARKPYTNSGGFGVACAAIEGLARQLAIELGAAGIRVVALRSSGSPDAAGVSAAIAEHARAVGVTLDEFKARIAEKTMLKRMPAVAEVANAAALMASDRASAITAAVTNLTCGEIAD